MRQDFILLNKIRDNIPTDIFGGLMKDAVYLITVSQEYLHNNGYRRDTVDGELLPTLVYYYVFQHSCGDNKLRGFIDELSIEDVTRQTFYDYLDEVLDANLSHPIPRAGI